MTKRQAANVARALKRDHIPRAKLGPIVLRRAAELKLTSRDELAQVVQDAPSQMSRLFHKHFNEFSADRKVGYLLRLGCNVDVVVHARRRGGKGRCRVTYAQGG